MVKTVVKKIFNQLGYEVINKKAPAQLYYDLDREFHDRYELAQEKCQMAGTDNALRRQRHYTLSYLFKERALGLGRRLRVRMLAGAFGLSNCPSSTRRGRKDRVSYF